MMYTRNYQNFLDPLLSRDLANTFEKVTHRHRSTCMLGTRVQHIRHLHRTIKMIRPVQFVSDCVS
jgi:hypothetical protein